MRGQLIERYFAAEGNQRNLQYVTDGMKLSPLNPTMLQARDAIVTAAQVSEPSDVCSVWRGFATRNGFGSLKRLVRYENTVVTNLRVTLAYDHSKSYFAITAKRFSGFAPMKEWDLTDRPWICRLNWDLPPTSVSRRLRWRR